MGCCMVIQRGDEGQGPDLEAQTASPMVGIPDNMKGPELQVDGSLVVRGKGSALASAPIEQDAAYWEVKVIKPGSILVGVSRKLRAAELSKVLNDSVDPPRWWLMDNDALKEGDVVGVAFGQSDLPNLSFTVNGSSQPSFDVKRIGGLVYPVFSVADGAEIQVVFQEERFESAPPPSFKPLMIVRSLL